MSFTAVVRRVAGALIVAGLLSGCVSAPVGHRADYGYRDHGVRYYDAAPVYVQPVVSSTRVTIRQQVRVVPPPVMVQRVETPRARPVNVGAQVRKDVRAPGLRDVVRPDRPRDGHANVRAPEHRESASQPRDDGRRGSGITPDGRTRPAAAARVGAGASGSMHAAGANDGKRSRPTTSAQGNRTDAGRGGR